MGGRILSGILVSLGCTTAGGYLWQNNNPRLVDPNPRVFKSLDSNSVIRGQVDWVNPSQKTLFLKGKDNNLLPPLTIGPGVDVRYDGKLYKGDLKNLIGLDVKIEFSGTDKLPAPDKGGSTEANK